MDNRTTGQSQFIRRSDITTTTWSSPSDLPIGQYRVWVRAIDAAGLPGTWSAPVNFSVVTPPTPESPLDSTFNRRPTFFEESRQWCCQLRFCAARSIDRHRRDHSDGLVGRIFAPTADIPDGPYRWWVVAKSAEGFVSQSSEPVNFFIGGRPDLLSPSGSTTDTTPTFIWKTVPLQSHTFSGGSNRFLCFQSDLSDGNSGDVVHAFDRTAGWHLSGLDPSSQQHRYSEPMEFTC